MAATDPRIDAYIARQADFARPILEHLRRAVHQTAPEAEETIKWGMPHFTVGGRILAGMGAFKAHVTFGFGMGKEVLGDAAKGEAMGQFGRLTSVADLPDEETLTGVIRRAADAVAAGPKAKPKSPPKPEAAVPEDLAAALAATPAARATFDAFPPSCRREYVDWVTEAKRPETRAKRLAQAVEWMAEGKRRNWKYETADVSANPHVPHSAPSLTLHQTSGGRRVGTTQKQESHVPRARKPGPRRAGTGTGGYRR